MTKEKKDQKLLECKANAYDTIHALHLTLDSHRNFHRRVGIVIAGVADFKRQLAIAPTTQSEQFPCDCMDDKCEHCHGHCNSEATCQITKIGEDDNNFTGLVCERCANSALHRGVASIVEESCPELGQD